MPLKNDMPVAACDAFVSSSAGSLCEAVAKGNLQPCVYIPLC